MLSGPQGRTAITRGNSKHSRAALLGAPCCNRRGWAFRGLPFWPSGPQGRTAVTRGGRRHSRADGVSVLELERQSFRPAPDMAVRPSGPRTRRK